MKPTLNLPIKAKWFDMIAHGVKHEEYRDCEHRQIQRAYLDAFNDVSYWKRPRVAIFRNGYTMDAKALAVEIVGYDLRGRENVKHPDWGEPTCRRLHLVVKLGRILCFGKYTKVRDYMSSEHVFKAFPQSDLSITGKGGLISKP